MTDLKWSEYDFTKIPYGDAKTKVHFRFLNWKATDALEN